MEEEIRISIDTNKQGEKSLLFSRWVNGKCKESYRPTDEIRAFMDFASFMNGFEPERSPRHLEKSSDQIRKP